MTTCINVVGQILRKTVFEWDETLIRRQSLTTIVLSWGHFDPKGNLPLQYVFCSR